MLNFRYGKSYARTAEDCMYDFESSQRRVADLDVEAETVLRTRSAPKLVPIRGKDEVLRGLQKIENSYIPIGKNLPKKRV